MKVQQDRRAFRILPDPNPQADVRRQVNAGVVALVERRTVGGPVDRRHLCRRQPDLAQPRIAPHQAAVQRIAGQRLVQGQFEKLAIERADEVQLNVGHHGIAGPSIGRQERLHRR